MTAIAKSSDIKKLGRILGIWAHPDDETWSCAGIMTIAADNNQAVKCITATRGEQGVQDEKRWPAATLGKTRTKELEIAMDILGKGKIDHQWLQYHDGSCEQVPLEEAVAQVSKIIDDFGPDTILTFGPEGLTGHPDHATVSRWTSKALEQTKSSPKVFHVCESRERYEAAGKRLDEKYDIYFNIDKPPLCDQHDLDICLKLDAKVLERKLKALRAQESQTSALFSESEDADLLLMATHECFCAAKN